MPVHHVCTPIIIGDASVLSDAQRVARTSLETHAIFKRDEAKFPPINDEHNRLGQRGNVKTQDGGTASHGGQGFLRAH